jgi:hypothetical protein
MRTYPALLSRYGDLATIDRVFVEAIGEVRYYPRSENPDLGHPLFVLNSDEFGTREPPAAYCTVRVTVPCSVMAPETPVTVTV